MASCHVAVRTSTASEQELAGPFAGDPQVGIDRLAGRACSVQMARRRTARLLILKHGEIALERYGMGNGPESRWASFSTAKSITAMLVGTALRRELPD